MSGQITYKIGTFKDAAESKQQFTNDLKKAVGNYNGTLRLVSKVAYHAFVHYYRHSHDTSLIAKLYNALVNETCDDKMAKALKAAAKDCCAVTIQLDISRSKATDAIRHFKAIKNTKNWEEIQEGGAWYIELKRLETCFDEEATGREVGLGAFMEYAPRAPSSKGGTVVSLQHKQGKESANYIKKAEALSPKIHNEAWNAKLARLKDQIKQLHDVIVQHYKDGEEIAKREAEEAKRKEAEEKAAQQTVNTGTPDTEAENDETLPDEVAIG